MIALALAAALAVPGLPSDVRIGAVTADRAGNVYAVDVGSPESDANPGGIYRIAPGGAVVKLGIGFLHPEGAAVDGAGNVYVADTNHGAIKRIAPDGKTALVKAGFSFPRAVAVAPNCTQNCMLFVLDDSRSNIVVKRIAADGAVMPYSPFATTFVSNLIVDDTGNVFTSQTAANEVVKIAPGGGIGVYARGFKHPFGVFRDASGTVYVADGLGNAIRTIAPNGRVGLVFATDFPMSVAATAKAIYFTDSRDRLFKIER
jgi:large repetitive protein